jgi:hypothetical protein
MIPMGYGTRTTRRVLECVICLEDFVEGDVIITLPCDHEFHESCMYHPNEKCVLIINSTPWLTTRRRLCPICKRDIIVETAEVDEQSSLLNHREGDWRGDTAGSV